MKKFVYSALIAGAVALTSGAALAGEVYSGRTGAGESQAIHAAFYSSVKEAQKRLKCGGYNVGPIDGIHGSQTTAAIKAFQKGHDLDVNGKLDNATAHKLHTHHHKGCEQRPASHKLCSKHKFSARDNNNGQQLSRDDVANYKVK